MNKGLKIFFWGWLLLAPLSVFSLEVKNDIVVFSDKTEAVNYAFQNFWHFLNEEEKPKAYERVDQFVEELWPYFCRNYPDCENYPKPEILFTIKPSSGSFGFYYDGEPRQTNAIILSQELLDSPEDMEFVLAHEMVHYFEKHAAENNIHKEIKSVKRQVYGHCLDYPFPFEDLKKDLVDMMKLINHIGEKPHMVSAWHSLSFEGDSGVLLDKMVQMTQHLDDQCSEMRVLHSKISLRLEKGNYFHGGNRDIKNFISLSSFCFEKYQGNLIQDAAHSEGISIEGPDPGKWKDIQEFVQKDGPELERLQEIRRIQYREYLILSRKLSAPQLRYQNEEDIADIKALNILLHKGKRNLREYLDYLLIDLKPAEQIRCLDDLKKGREPDYGPLNREHHSECWRIWRAIKVEERYNRKTRETDD